LYAEDMDVSPDDADADTAGLAAYGAETGTAEAKVGMCIGGCG
jgi:hypothetical protein